jgi:SprT protein
LTSSFEKILSKYLPAPTVNICASWIAQYNIHLRITRSRATKYGDYRPLHKSKGHQITVNHDLNLYAFLITFTHEVAHLLCEIKHSRKAAPHGKEWKQEFSVLLSYFIHQNIFPIDLETALVSYLKNPAASSCSDYDLFKALKKHDQNKQADIYHLEEIPEEALFKLHATRSSLVFKKGTQLRSRFHCLEINSKRHYYVSPLAEVILYQSV